MVPPTTVRFRLTMRESLYAPRLHCCVGYLLRPAQAPAQDSGSRWAPKPSRIPSASTKQHELGWKLELVSSRQYGDHFEVALTLSGSSLGSLHDEYTDFADGVAVEDSFKADLALFDVRLAARFYPLGDSTPLQPYFGAGVGYYWFLGFWEDTYSETAEDPYMPGVFHTFTEFTDGTDTMAHGLFPFIMAGMTVSASPNLELVFEFQYDFDKGNSEFDLSGPVYMVGCRFRM